MELRTTQKERLEWSRQLAMQPIAFDRYAAGDLIADVNALEKECWRLLTLLNTPEIGDFDRAIPLEAAHQVERWGSEHDAGKSPADWFWLVGYLAGKALAAHISGNVEKAKHHCISTAAVLRNWHAHIGTGETRMRPGIGKEKTMAIESGGAKEHLAYMLDYIETVQGQEND